MTILNNDLLKNLFRQGIPQLIADPWLFQSPEPLPENLDFDRIEGMLLGLAIGDALGNTSEGINPDVRHRRYGEIRDYLPNPHAGGLGVGLPSDDTQMAFWTLEQLVADGGLVPDHVASRFCQEQIYGIGSTVKQFLLAYKDQGVPWERAGQHSAGNGALMRIAPIIIPHLHQPEGLNADAVLCGMITHNDWASNACCVAFVHLLWKAVRAGPDLAPEWWLETFCEIASKLEGHNRLQPRYPNSTYEGPLWKFVQEQVEFALSKQLSVLDACNRWFSGAYLLETVPSVLYILCKFGHEPEEAILRAVNDTRDNDTIAAIVGAAVGAWHGKNSLPDRWKSKLLGRTGSADDGRIFQLIDKAKEEFFE